MKPWRRRLSALALIASALGVGSLFGRESGARADSVVPGERVAFASCPVYRDTDMGRKSGCWLATDAATRRSYDLSFSPVKPLGDHEVLVEGVVTAEPDVCGGAVLKPVRVSVLPGACRPVRIPAAPYSGRPAPPPVETLRPAREPRTLPPGPYEPRTFQIYFELGRDFLIYQHAEVVLEKVMLYVKASGAQRVDVTGYAATEPLRVSGRSLSEPLALAQARAEMAAEALRRLQVPASILHVAASGQPAPTDFEGGQLPEPSKRRVTITVTP